MVDHPAVEFLRQAHARAEELARYTGHDYAWTAKDDTYGPIVQVSDTDEHYWTREGGHSAWTCDDPYDDCASVRADLRDEAQLIAAHADPAAVLRRVAAEQVLEELHQPVNSDYIDGDGESRDSVDCETCDGGGTSNTWPCRTVLLLAQAWGWAEEAP